VANVHSSNHQSLARNVWRPMLNSARDLVA
jgi:hypothetical protein